MSENKTGYYVWFTHGEPYERYTDYEFFPITLANEAKRNALEFINKNPNWSYTVIFGEEKELETVSYVTEIKFK